MKLNTIVRLPDGREGTICYHSLDGTGGVWSRESFTMPEGGFGDELPKPEFLLREYSDKLHKSLVSSGHRLDLELVGEDYEVVEREDENVDAGP